MSRRLSHTQLFYILSDYYKLEKLYKVDCSHFGQTSSPHDCASVDVPGQGAPPCIGGGLSQVRIRVCVPPLQLTEHVDQDAQYDQAPFSTAGIISCHKLFKIQLL